MRMEKKERRLKQKSWTKFRKKYGPNTREHSLLHTSDFQPDSHMNLTYLTQSGLVRWVGKANYKWLESLMGKNVRRD